MYSVTWVTRGGELRVVTTPDRRAAWELMTAIANAPKTAVARVWKGNAMLAKGRVG